MLNFTCMKDGIYDVRVCATWMLLVGFVVDISEVVVEGVATATRPLSA